MSNRSISNFGIGNWELGSGGVSNFGIGIGGEDFFLLWQRPLPFGLKTGVDDDGGVVQRPFWSVSCAVVSIRLMGLSPSHPPRDGDKQSVVLFVF